MSSSPRKFFFQRHMDALIHHLYDRLAHGRVPFFRLMRVLQRQTGLLAHCSQSGRDQVRSVESVIRACALMANNCHSWCREPEDWLAPQASATHQFQSLVAHLFDRYPVPRLMARIWTEADVSDALSRWQIDLYLHLAQGRSLRAFPWTLPFPVNKAVAAHFMQAPDDLRLFPALRWAWIRSFDADSRLARRLALHPCLNRRDSVYIDWSDTVRFLVRHQPICDSDIEAIIQFVDQQKHQLAEVVWGPGAGQQPLQPDFSLKGRTLLSLWRYMANWRTELLLRSDSVPTIMCTRWPAAEIQPFRCEDGERVWVVDEIRTAKELHVEGRILRHCVGSYAAVCASRRTTIWSMKVEQAGVRRRVLTIEVRPDSKKIVQMGGKRNARPTHRVAEMLHRWADQEGLVLPAAQE